MACRGGSRGNLSSMSSRWPKCSRLLYREELACPKRVYLQLSAPEEKVFGGVSGAAGSWGGGIMVQKFRFQGAIIRVFGPLRESIYC